MGLAMSTVTPNAGRDSNDLFKMREIDEALRSGNSPRAMGLAKSGLDEALKSGEPAKVAEAWLLLSKVHGYLQNGAESLRSLESAVKALPGPEDSAALASIRCRCLSALTVAHISSRQNAKARQFLDRAMVAAGQIPGNESILQQNLLKAPLCWLLIQSGDFAGAMALVKEAISSLPARPELHQPLAQMLALLVHCRALAGAESLLEPSDVPAGAPLPIVMEAVAVHTRRLFSPEDKKGPLEKPEVIRKVARWLAGWLERVAGKQTRLSPDCLMMLAEIEAVSGDFSAMAEALGRAARLYNERSEMALMLGAERARVAAHARAGEMDKALALSGAIVDRLGAADDPGALAEVLAENGQVRLAHGDMAGASASFTRVIGLLSEVPNPQLEAVARLSLGVMAAKSGRREEAASHLGMVKQLVPESHQLHQIASQNLQGLMAQAARPPEVSRPREDLASMLKDNLPPELAGRMESLMKLASSLPKATGSMDPATANALAEMEARTMQHLQGILGQFKDR
jgi:tetratricopeptide (TPR) repeat protein